MTKFIKYLLLSSLLIINQFQIFSQLDSCILISAVDFQGTLFQENYEFDISPDNSGKLKIKPIEYVNIKKAGSWTPNENDIFYFEDSLKKMLTKFQPEDEYEKEGITYILSELVNYKRQYIGFVDSLNNECLWIKFYLSDQRLNQPDKTIIEVFGGGANFFTLWVNLSNYTIIGLVINGPI